jgi:hypothetical protein
VSAAPFAYLADRNQNAVSVVELATYSTVSTMSLGATPASPVEVVANAASGKIFVAQGAGIAIIDAATNSIIGNIAVEGVKAMVVSPDGKKIYALTSGSVAIIDTDNKSVLTTLVVDPSAVSMAIDKDGETIYVAHTGFAPGTVTAAGVPGVTIIDGLINDIDSVIDTGDFRPERLAVHPVDDRLYMIGSAGSTPDPQAYRVFDPVTQAISRLAFTPAPETPLTLALSSLAFNRDGSRLYLGGRTLGATAIPVLEIDTATGTVARVLSVPAGFGNEHTALKLATSFANDKFVMAIFVRQRLQSYPVEPGRRAVFIEVGPGTILGDFNFPSPGDVDVLTGDIIDLAAAPGQTKVDTRTLLQASASPPLSPTAPVTFFATVTGNNPIGKVVFKFVAQDGSKLVQKVPVVLSGGMATLALPACNTPWENPDLRRIVCSPEFRVVARFKGDVQNAKSKSNTLTETY